MKNELTIMWKEEVQPSIEMLKDKINLEETEIKLCKSWLWTNKRTLEWISDLRNWFYHSDNWKFNCLPEMELIHPELFTEDKEPTNDEIKESVRTRNVSITSNIGYVDETPIEWEVSYS